MASAHAEPEETVVGNAAEAKPVLPIPKPPAHAGTRGAPATKKAIKPGAARQASADGIYRLSHQPHQLDSYQKAVTPQVSTGR